MQGAGLHQVVAAVERLADAAVAGGAAPLERLADDCLRVVYRLLFVRLARLQGAQISTAEAVASLALDLVPSSVLGGALLDELVSELPDVGAAEEPGDAHRALGALHEAVLTWSVSVVDGRLRWQPGEETRRKAAGSWFTPPSLVGWLLDQALEPTLDELDDPSSATVLDPSCGGGAFLVEATRRLRRRGVPAAVAVRTVAGVDRDAAAVEVARICLWLELVEPGCPAPVPELALRVDDALLGSDWLALVPSGGFDVVVGNPPFLNQLERLTAHGRGTASALDALSDGTLRPYTDVSAVFLQRAPGWVRPGGRVALVQPQSVLAARDAGGVRSWVVERCALEALWASDVPVFAAHVLTCAPVLRRAAVQGPVRRFHGPSFDEQPPFPDPQLHEGWAYLLAPGLGIPEVTLSREHGVLADLAECTADFRDQYYGLAPYVHEASPARGCEVAPLVTTGLVDPALSLWGERPTRFLKRRWLAPVVDLEALREDEALHRWAERRLVPKVLVGTQGKVIEAVADEAGAWLPSVPTISVVPDPDRLWHVLAVLLAPPVSAQAAASFAGTALSMRAIKLSARQVSQLPLPADHERWDAGAVSVRSAQRDPRRRREHLVEAARQMCAAYGTGDEVLEWWLDRL